jgi:trehalose-6-phosphate synthase
VLAEALGMSIAEQSKRMRLLRANVATFDASWWAHQLIHDAMLEGHRSHTNTGRPWAVGHRISA